MKDTRIEIRCTEENRELLKRVAGEDGISLSSWVLLAALEKARER